MKAKTYTQEELLHHPKRDRVINKIMRDGARALAKAIDQDALLLLFPKIKAIHDKIWIIPDPPAEKFGSIYIPEAYQVTIWSGIVVAVGPGDYDKYGNFKRTRIKVGDHVVIDTARAVQNTFEGVEYMITREKEILFYILAGEEIDLSTFTKSDRPTRKEWEEIMHKTQRGECERRTA